MGELLTLTLTLIVQYGLPSVALCIVVWASATGKIYWSSTVDALNARIADAQKHADQERLEKEMYRDALMETKPSLERGVRVTQQAERVSRGRA